MLAAIALSVLAAVAPSVAKAGALHVAPCTVAGVAAKCGTFTVYENRVTRHGRTIDLHFVVLKAKHPSGRAIVFNPGGPGASAVAMAPDFAADTGSAFARLRDRYDLLLVDNRGTGASAPQNCDFAPPAHPELYFAQLWPDSLVKACRAKLAAGADLNLYSTSVAADDLDDVRAALGYGKLVLFGGSYGTTFYLAYARQHPGHVESVILEGVAPPHFYLIPLPMAGGAQTSMNNLIAACSTDARCSSHFPSLAQHFDALVHRFDRGPIDVPVRNAVTKQMQTVALSKEVFTDTLRHVLYSPSQAAYVPVVIERAYNGKYAPLASLINDNVQEFAHILAAGLNLSVSCAEDNPFITESDVARSSAGSFEGDLRVRAQQRACAIWHVRPVAHSFQDPVHSAAPILMVSGSDDPATPPQYAHKALADLPNGRMLLVKGASHDSDMPPCVWSLEVAFVRAASAKGLNFGNCAATYRRPSFHVLALDESAPDENPAVTARVRTFVTALLHAHLDRSQIGPALSNELSDTVLKSVASQAAQLGAMRTLIYKGGSTTPKGKTYRYVITFENGDAEATMTVGSDHRIEMFDLTPL
ncbi:MAG TPA: alpha/beta fold hydrolase [Candidatus Aquilonibacter sp.]|nr:alpha/beta fold hydrolase [Candidatus Aquilonibacter sp.]